MFAMVAEFPLGKYVGHFDGLPEFMPSPARVHAALLCAAAQGPDAVDVDGTLVPSAADLDALTWIEAHPPTGVRIPDSARAPSQEIAYREMGLLKQKKRGTKKFSKPATRGYALSSGVAWCWEDAPPKHVQERLEALCREVPYLGSADSPVRMRVSDTEPSHIADPNASLFDLGGHALEVATTGRSEALCTAHDRLHAGAPSEDPAKVDEVDAISPRVTTALTRLKYRTAEAPSTFGPNPWGYALIVEIEEDAPIRDDDRVAWSVALHKALISVIGYGASPVVTGKYDVAPPANHLAIQVLDDTILLRNRLSTRQAFLLMFPSDVDASTVVEVTRALNQVRVLRGHSVGGRALRLASEARLIEPADFWRAPEGDLERVWATVPAAIPDTRPIRGAYWSWSDTVSLSVALAWRDYITASPTTGRNGVRRGDLRYVTLVEAATESNVEVLQVTPLRIQRPQQYVHRIADGTLLRPYTALISLGKLGNPCSVAAIGQSRHLGTGLLTPIDVPESVLNSWRRS